MNSNKKIKISRPSNENNKVMTLIICENCLKLNQIYDMVEDEYLVIYDKESTTSPKSEEFDKIQQVRSALSAYRYNISCVAGQWGYNDF